MRLNLFIMRILRIEVREGVQYRVIVFLGDVGRCFLSVFVEWVKLYVLVFFVLSSFCSWLLGNQVVKLQCDYCICWFFREGAGLFVVCCRDVGFLVWIFFLIVV